MLQQYWLIAAVLVSICVGNIDHRCSAMMVQDQDAIETCSVFAIAVANMRSIESADVLIRIRETADTFEDYPAEPDGLTLNTECFRRVAFDFKEKDFVQLNRKNVRILHFEKEIAHEAVEDEIAGFCLDFSRGILFSNDIKYGYREKRKFPDQIDELAKILRQFDVRGFWMYPLDFEQPDAFIRGQRQWEGYKSARLFDSSRMLENGQVEINFKIHGPVDGPAEMQWHFVFDENQLPISMSEIHVAPENCSVPAGTALKGPWMKLKWQKVGDYFVPQSYEMKTITDMQVGSKESKPLRLFTTVDLEWLSINQPIEKSLLDSKSVSDRESIIKLTTPEFIGADSLKAPVADEQLPIQKSEVVK